MSLMSSAESAAKQRLANCSLKCLIGIGPSLLIGACVPGEGRVSRTGDPVPDSVHVEARAISTIQVRPRRELRENSAAVASLSQRGVLFTINDSGNDPVLFTLDTAGNDRGAWVIRGARNIDWEAAALGPCGRVSRGDTSHGGGAARDSARTDSTARCIYIGDVGDNAASRATRVIYRVVEPRAANSGVTDSLSPEQLTFRYSDGPHDVEALWVGADGTTWLITKRRLKAADGTARAALVFALPASAWQRSDSVATARLVDSIPVVPGSANGRLITDAALSPEGTWLAVRTYSEVFVFAADPGSGRVASRAPRFVCDITFLREQQGEGIAWLRSSGRLLLTSEGHRSPMHVIACGAPARPD